MQTPFSIIVITLNEASKIGALLHDLAVQNHRQFEVILVDSNSSDNTLQIAESYRRQLPALTLVKMDRQGVSLGRNTGAQYANYQRLVFLDADVRLDPGFLSHACGELDRRGLKVAGGRMHNPGSSLAIRLGLKVFNTGMLLSQYVFPTAVGACIFSTREVHQDIGGFDSRISLCEDCDYVRRASRSYRFAMLKTYFTFDDRRLVQDGLWRTGLTYLKANLHRARFGELIDDNRFNYRFGHYR